jgi:hypothetical protein
MTIKELRDYYATGYSFNLETGMAANSYENWIKWGFIPVHSQMRLQKYTSGALVARIEDGEKV